jgi:hypothetical protein
MSLDELKILQDLSKIIIGERDKHVMGHRCYTNSLMASGFNYFYRWRVRTYSFGNCSHHNYC